MHLMIRRCELAAVEHSHLLYGDAAFHNFLAPEWDAQLVQPLLDLIQGVCLHNRVSACQVSNT